MSALDQYAAHNVVQKIAAERDEARAEVVRLTAERDLAREDCGHQRAMKESIRAELSVFIRLKMGADAEIERLRGVVQRVDALHRPMRMMSEMGGAMLCEECVVPFPCSTAAACHREGDGMSTERTVTDSAALDEIAERYKTWGQVEIFDDASSTIEFIGYVIESTGRKAWFEEPGYLSGEETA